MPAIIKKRTVRLRTYTYPMILSQRLPAPGTARFWTTTTASRTDGRDDDELRKGSRRQGLFGAIGNWPIKVTGAATLLMSGLILELTGFDRSLGSIEPPETNKFGEAL